MTLSVLDDAHLEEVHGLFSAPGHTLGDGPVTDRRETIRWLRRRAEVRTAEGLAWYGLWTRDHAFAGTCGLFRGDRCGTEPEIGYEVAGPVRGLRYGEEAAAAVTRAAHRAGIPWVWATVRPTNRSSVRIVESLGYEPVRTQDDAKGPLAYYRHGAEHELSRTATVVLERESVAMGDDCTAPNPFLLQVPQDPSGKVRLRDVVDAVVARYDGPRGGWVSVMGGGTTWILAAVRRGPALAVLTCQPVRLHAYTCDPETMLDPRIPMHLYYALQADPEALREVVAREPFRRRL